MANATTIELITERYSNSDTVLSQRG